MYRKKEFLIDVLTLFVKKNKKRDVLPVELHLVLRTRLITISNVPNEKKKSSDFTVLPMENT